MVWKEKNEYVKRQHYIPQFSIRPFEIKKGICLTLDLNSFEVSEQETANILQEIDLYEVQNEFGEYINRNEIEDSYTVIEKHIAPKLKRFVEWMENENFQKTYRSMLKGKKPQWADIEAGLLLHLIVTLIRSPKVKELIFNPDFNELEFMKPIAHRQMTAGTMKAVELAKNLLQGQELEFALHFLKEEKRDVLGILMRHIMEGYQLKIFRVSGQANLFLADEPIIIQKFGDADYVLPVSPKLCIGAIKLRTDGEMWQIDSKVYNLTDDEVREINLSSVQNATSLVIIQKEEDLDIVKNIMERNN